MKKLFCLALLAIFSSGINAQESSDVGHELGINSTFFIQQFVINGNSALTFEPYVLTYKRLNAKRRGLRIGLGGSTSYTSSSEDASTNKVTNSQNSGSLRVGWEWQKSLGDRWNFYYGLDGVADINSTYTKSITSFSTDETETYTGSFGLGLVGGIHFQIGERIALNTEFGGRYMYTSDVTKTSSTFSPGVNNRSEEVSFTTSFVLPTTLYFIIKL